MIIKSWSGKEPLYWKIIEYIDKGSNNHDIIISRNLYNVHNRKKVLREYMKQYELLPSRKNGNAYYHEIISFQTLPHIPLRQQEQAIADITNRYLEKRATNLLCYGRIHSGTDPKTSEQIENTHVHLCLSSNEMGSRERYSIDKEIFNDIRKEIEEYALEQYKEFQFERRYTKEQVKEHTQSYKGRDREYRQKHRTGEKSRNDELRRIIIECISESYSKEQMKQKLKAKGLAFYERGEKTVGIVDLQEQAKGKRKANYTHRFKTLGVLADYSNLLEHEKAIREFEEVRDRELERD